MSVLKPRSHQISNYIQSAIPDYPGDCDTEQGNPLIPPQCYLKMDVIEVVGVRDDVDPEAAGRRIEENLLDENVEIFDTILVGEAIETARGKLETLKNQGRDTCGVFKYFFHFFSVNQTPHFPEFVEWCVENFSVTEGVIINKSKSKILF